MKKLLYVMILLLALTGCTKQEVPVPEPEPEAPPVQVEAQTPAAPEAEPEPAPQPEPEPPAVEEPQLPDLPLPVYCWGDTAVSRDGTVILQVPNHTLQPCYDAVSGEVRGILSYSNDNLWTSNGIYDLQGQPLPIGISLWDFGCAGDLCWYGALYEYTVQRLSDGEILAENVKRVYVLGDRLLLTPTFKYGAFSMLDTRTGEVAMEAESGFRVTNILFHNGKPHYAVVQGPDMGKENLIQAEGTPLLKEFQDGIYDVQQNCAIVTKFLNGQYIRQAIDLRTQEVVFQSEQNTYFDLLPEGAILETEAGWFLVDRNGNRLCDTALNGHFIYDWDGDDAPEYLLATVLRDDRYCTVVLKPDGTEIAELPAERWQDVTPLSPTTLAYTVYSGEGALHQKAYFRNLETGEESILAEGSGIFVRQIETSGGHMIRCEVDGNLLLFLNDGTPARRDLGPCTYLGGDVFACEDGLRCLDGTWLYKPE